MRLTSVQVRKYKSIDDSGVVTVDPDVTVIVGQNEAGKSAFLEALHKARPVNEAAKYSVTDDYPRKDLIAYRRRHATTPEVVTELTYELDSEDLAKINAEVGFDLLETLQYTLEATYDNETEVNLSVREAEYVKHVVREAKLETAVAKTAAAAGTVHGMIDVLAAADLNEEGSNFLQTMKKRFPESLDGWAEQRLAKFIWTHFITPSRFLYFGDYQILPGKTNLPALQARIARKVATEEDRTVLALLEMAGIDLNELLKSAGYEEMKANLEAVSNSITGRIFEFWKQNQNLDVEIDIRADPADPEPPYDSGPNLYIRIKNRRHAVTVPFSQRSKGFIWFFSFLVWFDAVKAHEGKSRELVLLLDEPGLSLHGLAQADLLRYIDQLAADHQIIYTTHSPFMVHGDRLHQVRLVEDREGEGTRVTDDVTGSDPRTVFPLQAALGYTLAQNLFISKRNLLVEGPADLVYLQFFSAQLEAVGRVGLRDDITIVPVGGLDKLATFVALLGGNQLEMAILHDYAGRPDTRLDALVRDKLIHKRRVLNYGEFRAPTTPAKGKAAGGLPSTDIEDLISPDLYLSVFNAAFTKPLDGRQIAVEDLPPGHRLVERIGRFLDAEDISIRPSGGFNHYAVANELAVHPQSVDDATLDRFENLFADVNGLFSGPK